MEDQQITSHKCKNTNFLLILRNTGFPELGKGLGGGFPMSQVALRHLAKVQNAAAISRSAHLEHGVFFKSFANR